MSRGTDGAADGAADSAVGWGVVAAAAVSMFTVFGVAYSFGAFFSSLDAEFGASAGATALVFSVTISLSFALAPVAGRSADRWGPRPVMRVGAIALVAGMVATSRVEELVIGYLTYGIGVGVAVACGYVPLVATVSTWFVQRRAAALGVAVAGIGVGTLVGSPLSAALIGRYGWRTTMVLLGVGGAALLAAASLVARPGPVAVTDARPRPVGELVRLPTFAVLYGSSLLVSFGLFVPFVFIADYAQDRGAGEVAAATLVGIIGGASVVGRLGLGALAVRYGAIRLYRWSFVAIAASHLVWFSAGDRFAQLLVYAVALGVGYGGFIAISPAVVAEIFGLDGMGGVLGTLYTSAAVGSLAGPPLAGVLIENSGYPAAVLFAVGVSVAAAALLWRLRVPVSSPAR